MSTLTRRRVLTGAGALGALFLGGAIRARPSPAQPRFSDYPFKLGVASGDPQSDGVVLWTRLAPDPLVRGGMGSDPVPVEWEVATDDGMQPVVQQGVALATADLAHSVHVEVAGLAPGATVLVPLPRGDADSADRPDPHGAGRRHAVARRLRFAFASCQHWRVRLLRRLSPHAERRPRPRRPPRRLHLRDLGADAAGVGEHGLSEPHRPRRLPPPPRALQDRRRPPGGPRHAPVGGDVGRPRGDQRLRRRPLAGPGRPRGVPAGGGAPPTRRTTSTCRSAPPFGP